MRISNFNLKKVFVFPWRLGTAVAVAAALSFSSPVQAAVEIGGIVSPFELGVSARVLGMGGVAVAVTGDGDGFFQNPAILATLSQNQILTFHAPLLEDTIYDSIGYVNPVAAHGSFGLGVSRLGTSNIPRTVNNIQAVSTFSYQQYQGLVAFGFEPTAGLDFGASVKYLYQQVENFQSSGMGADVGVLYHFTREQADYARFGYKNIILGLAISDALEPQTKLFQTVDNPKRVFRPALSYLYQFPGTFNCLWLSAEGKILLDGYYLLKAGAEYNWNNNFFARAGYDGESPTFGAGLQLSGFQLDYAFNLKELGALHRFSLTYRFGQYHDPQSAKKIDLLKWVARSYSQSNAYDPAIQAWQNVLKEYPKDSEAVQSIQDLKQKRQNSVRGLLNEAKKAMDRGDVDKALPLLTKILSLDPGNPEAKALMNQVDKKLLLSIDYIRGVEAYSKEDFATAVQYLQVAYEADPKYRDVAFLYHDAQSHYLPLKSMPKDLTDLYAKGVSFYINGQYDKAVEAWKQVIEKDPKNFLVKRNLEEAQSHLRGKTPPGAPPAGIKTPMDKK
jgi:tetratricopeptide (TPR) repeat protein